MNNSITIQNQPNPFILTRFLYVKDEVEIALLLSILQKRKEDSLFWAYELYYSGFQEEVFQLIWTIYIDFFATLNPLFETYLSTMIKEWTKEWKEEWNKDITLGILVENLLIRPFNTDVFMLSRLYLKENENIEIIEIKTMVEWTTSNNYQQIANYIFTEPIEKTEPIIRSALKQIDPKYKFKKLQLFSNSDFNKKQLLSRVLMCLTSEKPKKKQFYMMIDEAKIEPFKCDKVCSVRPYRILTQRCVKGTNDSGYLSLFAFALSRYKLEEDVYSVYHNDWLYYASFSPIWLHRIHKHNGIRDEEKRCVVFSNEEDEEEFYNCWNYEPDEQSRELKQKTIPEINQYDNSNSNSNSVCSWEIFQQNYNQNGIVKL